MFCSSRKYKNLIIYLTQQHYKSIFVKMSAKQVKLHLKKEKGKKNKLSTKIKTIKLIGEENTYIFPDSYQDEIYHTKLFELETVNNASKSMTKENQYRNITVTLLDDIAKEYIDADNNFVFKDFYLEEQGDMDINTLKNEDQTMKELSLYEIEKKFILDKFNGKNQNAKSWLQDFENECIRYKIIDDINKIQCLRLFLEGGAKDWYISARKKLNIEIWNEWTRSFLQTFADKGWSNVRYAYTYKYINNYGTPLEYALRKERLLLECEKTMTEISRISHIVVGLPIYIQDEIDKEVIETTEDLMNHLRKYESSKTKIRRDNFKPQDSEINENINKKPCYICTSIGKKNMYHLPEICRNKKIYNKEKKYVNLTDWEDEKFSDSKN